MVFQRPVFIARVPSCYGKRLMYMGSNASNKWFKEKNVLLAEIMREMLSCSKGGPKPSRNKWLSILFSRYISAYMEGCSAELQEWCKSAQVKNICA